MNYEINIKPLWGSGGCSSLFTPRHSRLDPKNQKSIPSNRVKKVSEHGKRLNKSGSLLVKRQDKIGGIRRKKSHSIEITSPRHQKDKILRDGSKKEKRSLSKKTRIVVGSKPFVLCKTKTTDFNTDKSGIEKEAVDYFRHQDFLKEKSSLIRQLRLLNEALRLCLLQENRSVTVELRDDMRFEVGTTFEKMDEESANGIHQLIVRALDLEIKGVFTDHGQWISIGKFLDEIEFLMHQNRSVKKAMSKYQQLLKNMVDSRPVIQKEAEKVPSTLEEGALPNFASDFSKGEQKMICCLLGGDPESSQFYIDQVMLLIIYPHFVKTKRFFELIKILLKGEDSGVSSDQKCRLLNLCRTWITRGYHLNSKKEEKRAELYIKYMKPIVSIGLCSQDSRICELAQDLSFHVENLYTYIKDISFREKHQLIKQLRTLHSSLLLCLSKANKHLVISLRNEGGFLVRTASKKFNAELPKELYQLIDRALDAEIKGVFTDHGSWVPIRKFIKNIQLLIQRNFPFEEEAKMEYAALEKKAKSKDKNGKLPPFEVKDMPLPDFSNKINLDEKGKNMVHLLQQIVPEDKEKPGSIDPLTLLLVYPHFVNTQKFFECIGLLLKESDFIAPLDLKCRLLNLCRTWISKRYHLDRNLVKEQLTGIWPIIEIGLNSTHSMVVDVAHDLSFHLSQIFLDTKEYRFVNKMVSSFFDEKSFKEEPKGDEIRSLEGMHLRKLIKDHPKSKGSLRGLRVIPLSSTSIEQKFEKKTSQTPRKLNATSDQVTCVTRQISSDSFADSSDAINARISPSRRIYSDEGGSLTVPIEDLLQEGYASQRRRATLDGGNDLSLGGGTARQKFTRNRPHFLHSSTGKKKFKEEVPLVAYDCFQISRAMVLSIPLDEFLLKNEDTVFLKACAEYFVRLSNFVKNSILSPVETLGMEDSPRKLKDARAMTGTRISFWIEVASKLVDIGDFLAGMAIVASLKSVEIERLIDPKVCPLFKSALEKWENLNVCFSPCNNFKNLKSTVKQYRSYIPYTGMLSQQLTSASENMEYRKDGGLNEKKFIIIGRLLSSYWKNFERLQGAFYQEAFTGGIELHTNLKACLEEVELRDDEDKDWDLSHRLKP